VGRRTRQWRLQSTRGSPLKRLTIAILLLLAAACAQQPPVVAGCDVVESQPVQFSGASTSDATAGDTVEARSFGPDCPNAVLSLTVRAGDGTPLWAFTAPAQTVFPGMVPNAENPQDAAQAMRSLLRRWARVSTATTAAQPSWEAIGTEGEAAPPALNEGPPPAGGPWSTPFDAITYADVRARALPTICYETSPHSAECIYWEAAVGAALRYVTFER